MIATHCRSLLAVRRVSFWTACVIGTAMASPVAAQSNNGVRLTDGSATFDYAFSGPGILPTNPQGSSGNVAMNFQLDGPPGNAADQQVVKGNWFYRYLGGGSDREFHLANATGRTLVGSNYVRYTFDTVYSGGAPGTPVALNWAEMDYTVFDTGPDSACATTQVAFTTIALLRSTSRCFWPSISIWPQRHQAIRIAR